MEELLRELEQSVVLREFLRSRVPKDDDSPGCAPCCKWILDDLEKNGKLTGYPRDFNGVPDYPIESKIKHLHLELVGGFPEMDDEDVKNNLVPAIVEKLRLMVVKN